VTVVGNASAAKLWDGWMKSQGESGGGFQPAAPESVRAGSPHHFSKLLLKLKVPRKAVKVWEQTCYTLDELLNRQCDFDIFTQPA
jgi:hypothetical protein